MSAHGVDRQATRKRGIMGWTKIAFFFGGVAAAGALKIASGSSSLRKAAVNGVAMAMEVNDSIQSATQDLMDEADDVRAEAERQRKIDAAVAERLAALEEGIREEVTAQVDGKPAPKKTAAKSKK